MCIAATARRRRRQAMNNYRHLSKMKRPRFKKRAAEVSDRRQRMLMEKQKAMQMRKGSSKR
jgi:hypothetical protein